MIVTMSLRRYVPLILTVFLIELLVSLNYRCCMAGKSSDLVRQFSKMSFSKVPYKNPFLLLHEKMKAGNIMVPSGIFPEFLFKIDNKKTDQYDLQIAMNNWMNGLIKQKYLSQDQIKNIGIFCKELIEKTGQMNDKEKPDFIEKEMHFFLEKECGVKVMQADSDLSWFLLCFIMGLTDVGFGLVLCGLIIYAMACIIYVVACSVSSDTEKTEEHEEKSKSNQDE